MGLKSGEYAGKYSSLIPLQDIELEIVPDNLYTITFLELDHEFLGLYGWHSCPL